MKLSLIGLLVLAGCPTPKPKPPPVDDQGDYPVNGIVEEFPDDSAQGLASPCGKACANLRAISCSDGLPRAGVSCYRGCLSMAKQQRVPATCWALSKTIEDARACGSIRCR